MDKNNCDNGLFIDINTIKILKLSLIWQLIKISLNFSTVSVYKV